jgi:hypothetical protein
LLLGTCPSVADSPALELKLTILESPTKVGQGIVVRVTTINESDHPVTYHNTNPFCNYSFTVLNSVGEAVAETDFKKRLSCGDGQFQLSGRDKPVTLKPGDSSSENLLLTEQYNFARPDDYSIRVNRKFPGIGDFSSNVVNLTVTGP